VGIQALAVLPNGDILALESTLAAFSSMTIGLVQYDRSTGAPTPWPITGAPSGIGHSLFFDAGTNGGAGAAIVGYAPTASSNAIFEVPLGGGPASSIVTYDNAVLTAGGGGLPTGVTLDGSGNLVVSHNNATTGLTRIDRVTGTPTTIAVSAFGSGQNALCYDPIKTSSPSPMPQARRPRTRAK
jgi:autotransporter-associated beta strand protein